MKTIFTIATALKRIHFRMLHTIGIEKNTIRETPVHKALVTIAFHALQHSQEA